MFVITNVIPLVCQTALLGMFFMKREVSKWGQVGDDYKFVASHRECKDL